ncbi:hypothetical protein CCMA1212_002516 [Trichoderma ghanense]|uniref:AT hook domain-containing protein n=1 Tax=Trichoderma ghanense TaxID=65468 RepID=A0ABY2H9H6_9HYPO
MARTRDDAKAAAGNAATDITRQPTEDAGVKKTPGRGRGRPKGSTKSPSKPPYVPTGRPRGRPKGSFKKPGESKAKTPKKPSAPLAPGQKRGRGRPRKSDVAQAQAQEDDEGRAAAESEANADDAEAEAGDDAADNQPGTGEREPGHSRESHIFFLVDVTGGARAGTKSALTPRQSPEYEVGPSSSFTSPAWFSRFKNIIG